MHSAPIAKADKTTNKNLRAIATLYIGIYEHFVRNMMQVHTLVYNRYIYGVGYQLKPIIYG